MASSASGDYSHFDENDTDYDEKYLHSYARRGGRRFVATVYDATAGRVTGDGILGGEDIDAGQPQRRQRPQLAPDEVLFRRKDAPVRYEEHDIYRSHERDLPQGGRGVLPESDLLRAIHSYSSRFYAALHRKESSESSVDECSMDETALLAFGILLEEAGREVLGERGHVVFTEAAEAVVEGDALEEPSSSNIVGSAPKEERVGVKRRRLIKTETDEE